MSAAVWGWILLHLTLPMDLRTRLAYALLVGGVLFLHSFRTAYVAHSKDSANRRQFKSLSHDALYAS